MSCICVIQAHLRASTARRSRGGSSRMSPRLRVCWEVGVILEGGGSEMANLDWSQCPAVESIPGKRSGPRVFWDTRMPVSTVCENLESGENIEEIMEWFAVTREQIVAVLEFAARSLDAPLSADRLLTSVDAHSL